ncbi:MAG TPA: T9SS type A sorting domain-containing protein [Bacteroidia bacterium]|nr:T9SS type A sorting domain-containing protein [Bacteroidia bacterium]HNU34297.1 T9SS type A sorting domain-containing protein [Bacteroidia bacterium]
MKKQLLLATAVAFAFGATAQNRMTGDRAYAPLKSWQVQEPVINSTISTAKKGGNSILSSGPIGTSQNAFGMAFGAKTQLWADPSINTVMFSHRNNAGLNGGSSGDIRADVSTDGGNTFAVDVMLYDNATNGGVAARYPQGAIYNPAGNTTATNAFGHTANPLLEGTNDAWGGYAFSSLKLDLTTPGLTTATTDASTGLYLYIANDMNTAKTGENYIVSPALDLLTDYTDNLIFSKGVWDNTSNTYNYTHTLLPAPMSLNAAGAKVIADYRIAFGDNGQTGYIVVIGHDDFGFSPDSAYYPMVWKTTDGGTTWAGPTRINLGPMYSALVGGIDGDVISTGFEADAVVDANNNLHIAVDVAFGGGFSIATAAGAHAICNIYTTDGGTNWYGQAMGQPQTFRGNFGDASATNPALAEDNRPQATRSWDGSKIFISWFDTDTVSFPALGNAYPDHFTRGFDPVANTITPVVSGSQGSGDVMMGVCSYYALSCGGSDYKVPFASQVITGTTPTGEPLNTGGAVQCNYNDDACVSDASYAPAPTGVILTSVKNPEVIKASSITVMPNPTSDFATVSYLVAASSYVKVNIVNILGETVASYNEGNKAPGLHQIKVDAKQFAAGVYTVNFITGKQTSTAKFVVK